MTSQPTLREQAEQELKLLEVLIDSLAEGDNGTRPGRDFLPRTRYEAQAALHRLLALQTEADQARERGTALIAKWRQEAEEISTESEAASRMRFGTAMSPDGYGEAIVTRQSCARDLEQALAVDGGRSESSEAAEPR